jgi:hypothetical protein
MLHVPLPWIRSLWIRSSWIHAISLARAYVTQDQVVQATSNAGKSPNAAITISHRIARHFTFDPPFMHPL